ncbi:unnamed protein product [Zymoseptoria tritici ST99CH_3D1]|nr:unnamed protein product [Zymoseptoria tritici ST99CH_3D1]
MLRLTANITTNSGLVIWQTQTFSNLKEHAPSRPLPTTAILEMARSSTFQPANHYADPIHDRFTAKEPTMRFTAALAFLATFAGLVSADCAFQGNGVDCTTAANDVQCGTCGEYIYRCEDKQCQSIIF